MSGRRNPGPRARVGVHVTVQAWVSGPRGAGTLQTTRRASIPGSMRGHEEPGLPALGARRGPLLPPLTLWVGCTRHGISYMQGSPQSGDVHVEWGFFIRMSCSGRAPVGSLRSSGRSGARLCSGVTRRSQ